MAIFADAIVDGTGYCGPVSLSCVTGLGTKDISKIVRSYYPYRPFVKGMWTFEIFKVLEHLKIEYKFTNNCPFNLLEWTERIQQPDKVYIVNVPNHSLVIKNNKIVCTQFAGKVMPLTKSRYIRDQVESWIEINSKPKNIFVPNPNLITDSEYKKILLKSGTPKDVYEYACFLGERWEDAEPIIASHCEYAMEYIKRFIKGRWKLAENAILQSFSETSDYVFNYIKAFLKARWLRAEDLARKYDYAYEYAEQILVSWFTYEWGIVED